MSVRHISEITRNMVQAHIRANIAAALSDLRTDMADPIVTTEPPQSYFIFPNAQSYKTPAIFTIVESFDFRLEKQNANHINANVKLNVAALVEDRDLYRLTIKADRYSAALHFVLAQYPLVDLAKNVKLVILVDQVTFSPEYSNAGDDPQGLFRKEVLLECSVQHYSAL